MRGRRQGSPMPKAANRGILCASRPVKWFVRLAVSAGAVVSGLYAVMGLMSHGVRLLVPVVVVVAILLVRPLLVLRGRTLLAEDRITVRRSPIGRAVVPISQVGLIETRRGLLLEWPVLCLRDGSMVELTAPMRFWFRADPAFDRDLDALRACVRDRVNVGSYHQWSLPRLVAGPLLTVAAVALILVDPPWASDVWPLRQHARRLPDVCKMLDARARRLLPGARVDRTFSGNDDSDAHVTRHMCQWNATHLAPNGMPLIDVGRLSIELELDRGVGPVSDAEEAHQAFMRAIRIGTGAGEKRIHLTGDEAELIIEPPGTSFAWVTVAVRKANVEEKVDLIYKGRAREHEAAETAEGIARLALSEIHFR